MTWASFHHPDISWPVIARRSRLEFMELLDAVGLFMTRGGWGIIKAHCYPSEAAYRNAVSRLKKSGLMVGRIERGKTPDLRLTSAGKAMMPDYFRPERYWKQRWNGIWYLLTYDVPEVDRKYRNVMRRFLVKMHMGCLQKSVWVTPRDIRPEFDDLAKGAGLDGFAYLFESKTVLGLPAERIVAEAWDFDRLYLLQDHYCRVAHENMERLCACDCTGEDLLQLTRAALEGYHAAMVEDPLLPAALLPRDYRGREVVHLHRALLEKAGDLFLNVTFK